MSPETRNRSLGPASRLANKSPRIRVEVGSVVGYFPTPRVQRSEQCVAAEIGKLDTRIDFSVNPELPRDVRGVGQKRSSSRGGHEAMEFEPADASAKALLLVVRLLREPWQ